MTELLNSSRSLHAALTAVARQRERYVWAAGLARAGACWLVLVLVLIVVDAISPWPAALRAAAATALVVFGLSLLWRSWPKRVHPHQRALDTARRIEHHYRLIENPLIAPVQLLPMHFHGGCRGQSESASDGHEQASHMAFVAALLRPWHRLQLDHARARQAAALNNDAGGDDFARQLIDRSQTRGRRTLTKYDPQVIVDRVLLRRRLWELAGVMLAWIVLGAMFPHLILGGTARLAQPWGDHVPFSLTRVAAAIAPAKPIMGGDVTVTATLSGRQADHAWLVVEPTQPTKSHSRARESSGAAGGRWPLRRIKGDKKTGSARFAFTLRQVTRPMTVYIQAGGGRSHRLRIEPMSPPVPNQPARAPDGPRQTSASHQASSNRPGLASHVDQRGPETSHGHRMRTGRTPHSPKPVAPAASGTYHQTLDDRFGPSPQIEAMMRQAPPAYRELIRRYFQRLNRDDTTTTR